MKRRLVPALTAGLLALLVGHPIAAQDFPNIGSQYIDYGARLMNSVLVTAFAAMRLGPADYERNGVAGFGDYEGRQSERYAAYVATAERRKPLPYLFTG